MKQHFYSHLVEIETITIKLTEIEISEPERQELIELAHDTIHHHVLDTILDELNEEDKKHFLKLLVHEDQESIWTHLKIKIQDIESKIKSAIERIKTEFHQDIQNLKNEIV